MLRFAGMNANDCFDNPMEAYNFNALKTNDLLDCAVKTTIKKFIFFNRSCLQEEFNGIYK